MAEHNRHECSLCLNDFVKPKIIDCHHSYCLHCLQDHVKKSAKNNKFLCPLCRREIKIPKGGVKNFSTNIYIEGVCVKNQAKTDIPACDVCAKVQSQFRCSDCEQYMCQSCKTIHDSLAVSKSHVVFSLDDNADDKLKLPTFCKKHKSAELEFYCRDCQTSICMKCLMAKHKDHNTPDLKDFMEETSEILDQLIQKMEGNQNKLKSELETIQCKISNERRHFKYCCEIIDSHMQRSDGTLKNAEEAVKNKMEEINQNNVTKLNKIEIMKENAIRGLEASINHTRNVLKNQSIKDMLKLSSDSKSIEQAEDADKTFTLPNLRLYTVSNDNDVCHPETSLSHGSVIYFDSNGESRDTKQCHTSTRWETMCRFIYYYYLMSFPWIYPIYFIFMFYKVIHYHLLVMWSIFGIRNQYEIEHVEERLYWTEQPYKFKSCICDIFSNTEGFEVNFSDLKHGRFSRRSPYYERYGCRWYIDISPASKTAGLRIYRDGSDRFEGLFGVRIDAYGIVKSLAKVDIYSSSLSSYNGWPLCRWECAINLDEQLYNDIIKIQIVIFEKDDFIYR